jgi:hypothetical protein
MHADRGVVDLDQDEEGIRELTGAAISVDDVAALVPLLDKHRIRPDAVFQSYHNHDETEFSPEMYAAYCGSLNCIEELRKRGSRFMTKLYLEDEYAMYLSPREDMCCLSDAEDSASSGDDEAEPDRLLARAIRRTTISPRMLAVALYGHDSDPVRAIDGRPTRLRAGFDALYYRALRKSFAPTGPAGKRARAAYTKAFEESPE